MRRGKDGVTVNKADLKNLSSTDWVRRSMPHPFFLDRLRDPATLRCHKDISFLIVTETPPNPLSQF
jgi:hypothetical protein